jgi:hypothetical protein
MIILGLTHKFSGEKLKAMPKAAEGDGMELTPEQRADFSILGWDDQVLMGLRKLKHEGLSASAKHQDEAAGPNSSAVGPASTGSAARLDSEPT